MTSEQDEIETRRPCPGCGQPIALLLTKNGKYSPANVEPFEERFTVVDAEATEFLHGKHESHFQTCSGVARLRDLVRGLNN